jgi:type IV secretory pathway VirB10-like protein
MSHLPPLDDPRDPRPRPSETASALDSGGDLRPSVAGASARGGLGLIFAGAVGLGLIAFVFLSSQRHAPEKTAALANGPIAEVLPPPPPPSDLATVQAAARNGTPPTTPPPTASTGLTGFTPPPLSPTPPPPAATQHAFAIDTAALGRKAPTLVVDLGEAPPPVASGTTAAGAAGASTKTASGGAGGAGEGAGLNADEKFAERVSTAEPERSRATVIHNTRETIPQGVLIPGVMETALNSDLPGFARAVISRDVRGFDGSLVLIPRGSRVIGQYKSAAAQGQSRAFVIWTRIIRPDGASIQIASSGTDSLGRAGLDGKVDRHFFEQFSGAILLTVLDAGVASLANQPSTQVVIGSGTAGTGLGAAAITPTPIPPTIKVAQGAPIRIFVARDLDFSTVGPAK